VGGPARRHVALATVAVSGLSCWALVASAGVAAAGTAVTGRRTEHSAMIRETYTRGSIGTTLRDHGVRPICQGP
jgi:hypothetical protein